MCCRYYIHRDTESELGSLAQTVDPSVKSCRAGDIRPSDLALTLDRGPAGLRLGARKWGYPSPGGRKGLVINARSESVSEKPLFRNGFHSGRIVVPASGFYEWAADRTKNLFWRRDSSPLYMAGICDRFDGEVRFAILTTAANETMKPVHDRMPLILEQDELSDWLSDDSAAEEILHQTPVLLSRQAEYEQLSFF